MYYELVELGRMVSRQNTVHMGFFELQMIRFYK